MLPIEAGSVVLSDAELIRVARIAVAGLPVIERRDGVLLESDRILVETLHHHARVTRARIARQQRRSKPMRAPAPDSTPPQGAPFAPSDQWPGTAQAAALYGVHPASLRRLAAAGQLPARRSARGWLLDPDALAAHFASRAGFERAA